GRGRRELGMVCDHRTAHGERAGGGKVDVLLRLGQRLLLVLLEELGGGIEVALGAVHAAKVRPRRGRGTPAGRDACAQRGVFARATRPIAGTRPNSQSAWPLPYLKVVKYLFTVYKAV